MGRKKKNPGESAVTMIKDRHHFIYDKERFKEQLMLSLGGYFPLDASAICLVKGSGYAPPAIYFGFPTSLLMAWMNQDIYATPRIQKHLKEGPLRGYATFRTRDVDENFQQSWEYRQYYEAYGQRDAMMAMFFDDRNQPMGVYSCGLFGDVPEFTEQQRDFFDTVAPYIFYAFLRYCKLVEMDFYSTSPSSSLQQNVYGIILTDGKGKIAWQNESARALFRDNLDSLPSRLPAELVYPHREVRHDKVNLMFRSISYSTPLGDTMRFRIDEEAERYLPVEMRSGYMYVVDTRRTEANVLVGYSKREKDVLRLLKDGLSDKEIAFRLSVTEKTVQTYTQRLYKKLGVRNRTEAAMKAVTVLLM